MKKKVALTAAAVALVGTLAVGGTLAWFTDTEEATNVVTLGNINIDLLERSDDIENKGWQTVGEDGFDGIQYDTVMPGKVLDKDAKVYNSGHNDALLRVKVDFLLGNEIWPVNSVEAPTILGDTSADWEWIDGYYYYKKVLNPGAETDNIISGVQLPAWTNDDMVALGFNLASESSISKDISVDVIVEAIQADNVNVVGEDGEVDLDALKTLFDTTEITKYGK